MTIHHPERGSDIDAWLKRHRDQYVNHSTGEKTGVWHAIDGILDDYRDHADTGTPLGQDVQGPAWM